MRRMCYRREFDRDDRYFISAVDDATCWDDLLAAKNQQPPIRVQNIPCTAGIDETIGNVDDFVSSLEDEGLQDSESTIYFRTREEYLKALHGQSEDWKLIGIAIDDVGVTMAFAYRDGTDSDILFLNAVKDKRIKLQIEVDCPSGNIEKYLLYIENGQYGKKIMVTEYEPWGYREIYFKNHSYIPEHPEREYFYASVIEHRR